jgi:hypothetical protein
MLPLDVSLLLQPVLPSSKSVLHQPELSPYGSVLQEPMLLLDISVLQVCAPGVYLSVPLYSCSLSYPRTCLSYRNLCYPWSYMFHSSLCCPWRISVQQTVLPGCFFPKAACAVTGLFWSTAAYVAHGHVCVQQPVLHLDVSFLQHPMLSLAASARVCPSVLLQTVLPASESDFHTEAYAACLYRSVYVLWQPVLYLDVSGLQQPCFRRGSSTAASAAPAWTCLFYNSLCCPWTFLYVCSLCCT